MCVRRRCGALRGGSAQVPAGVFPGIRGGYDGGEDNDFHAMPWTSYSDRGNEPVYWQETVSSFCTTVRLDSGFESNEVQDAAKLMFVSSCTCV